MATCQKVEHPPEDERLLIRAAAAKGCEVSRSVWDDPAVDWTAFDAILLRSTWDYHQKIDAFKGWLTKIEQLGVPLHNPVSTVRWNLDKRYLADLERAGVAIPRSSFVSQLADLETALETIDSQTLIVKPTVSATAWRTQKIDRQDRADLHRATRRILTESAALLQPFLPEIADGEWSLLFFAGKYSHATIKRPKADDFRVQSDFGGSYAAAQPDAWIVEAAEQALAIVSPTPLYARVDGVLSNDQFLLMELELIEPDLMLSYALGAAERLVNALLESSHETSSH